MPRAGMIGREGRGCGAILAAGLAAVLALAGCMAPEGGAGPATPGAGAMPAGDVPAAPSAEDACGAGALAGLVGGPASALDGRTGPGPVRLIRPGMAVTMDYNPLRLNATLDAGGRILRLSCG